jgi:hypothetical protein
MSTAARAACRTANRSTPILLALPLGYLLALLVEFRFDLRWWSPACDIQSSDGPHYYAFGFPLPYVIKNPSD